MTKLYLLLKFWRELLIAVLAFLMLILLMVGNHNASKMQDYQKQIKSQQATIAQYEQAQKAGAEYEQQKAQREVETQVIYQTVEKIVERPVYRNVCIDADGVSNINKAIANTAK